LIVLHRSCADMHVGGRIDVIFTYDSHRVNCLHISSPHGLLSYVADDNDNAVITLGHEAMTRSDDTKRSFFTISEPRTFITT
jgi:hypothetical protein